MATRETKHCRERKGEEHNKGSTVEVSMIYPINLSNPNSTKHEYFPDM